ncbi:hypothetical protein GON26_16990 [Flavobacterium sp. GA093]|uniref:Uncharacterized protein n=1 Tax=Flavobacterium hydrocarbonoxydans TaxID=2683249 RepID=A0A6I4NYK8_9FLAO|nr:hypothetical protein [Flavobacterium hydrocarbonoxydans]MWB96064.1 hypothetical protein [Flavobacterium hydrocarbonoxydans]
MKKIFLYSVIILLLVITVICIILKYKYQNDFMLNQSEKLNALMVNIDELSPNQKDEIGKIANDYKYHVYTYHIVAFLAFATAVFLIYKRKNILL